MPAGWISVFKATDFGLARYNPNGSLDPTFSGDGKQTTNFGGASDGASGVALQGDGKIVAVGCACDDSDDFALARYNRNGSPDPSFSGDGKQTTDLFGGTDRATGMALQGDGKIVAVGGTGGDFGLARYLRGAKVGPASVAGNAAWVNKEALEAAGLRE